MQKIKLFLKYFIVFMAIGLSSALIVYPFFPDVSIRHTITFGFTVQSLAAISLSTAQILFSKLAARASKFKPEKFTYEGKQHLEVVIDKTPRQIGDALRATLPAKRWELLEIEPTLERIKMEVWSVMSNHEIVEMWIEPLDSARSKVKATSQSIQLVKFFDMDFGKNRRNLNLLERILVA